MNTMFNKKEADKFFGKFQKIIWVLLSFMALYILLYTFEVCLNHAEHLGEIKMIPIMIEYLFGSCVVILGGALLFETLSSD